MPFATLSPSIPHSRSFFRRSGFFSGGEGCEWRAPRATVGESGDKAKNEFSGFIPLVGSRKGFSPHIPAPDFLFSSIPPSPPSTKPIIPSKKKEHSLLVLPSVHTILNFATKFFEMFTKKQSEHPQKVFQVFQVFRVFQV